MIQARPQENSIPQVSFSVDLDHVSVSFRVDILFHNGAPVYPTFALVVLHDDESSHW